MAIIVPCVTIVSGGNFDCEDSGRAVSSEAKNAKLVLRTTGGNNAGHTVYYEGNKIPLHLIPGGIVYPQVTAIICNGVAVNPDVLINEIWLLGKHISVTPDNLVLSDKSYIIMPYHPDLDEIQGTIRGNQKLGTTHLGIGPCFEDAVKGIGIRFQDLFLFEKDLREKLSIALRFHGLYLSLAGKYYTVDGLYEYCMKVKDKLKPFIKTPDNLITQALIMHEKILIEGSQADHRDLFFGDYPYVDSFQCSPSGTLSGAGIGPGYVREIIAVMKAYCSRVGNGPFPTELFDHERDVIRKFGHEYGTTTGRPRRCGWLDLVALSKTMRGYTSICLNHLDTIGKIGQALGHIKVCIAYKYKGKVIKEFPSDLEVSNKPITPIYYQFTGGWDIPEGCHSFEELPENAKAFIKLIEEKTAIRVKYIGVGPNNEDTIIR